MLFHQLMWKITKMPIQPDFLTQGPSQNLSWEHCPCQSLVISHLQELSIFSKNYLKEFPNVSKNNITLEAFFCKNSIVTLFFPIDSPPPPLNLCLIYLKFIWALATLSEHMHKKFEVNWTKIKGGCQSERKVSQLNSYSKMPLTVPHKNHLSIA